VNEPKDDEPKNDVSSPSQAQLSQTADNQPSQTSDKKKKKKSRFDDLLDNLFGSGTKKNKSKSGEGTSGTDKTSGTGEENSGENLQQS
jgi:hypothetical protein